MVKKKIVWFQLLILVLNSYKWYLSYLIGYKLDKFDSTLKPILMNKLTIPLYSWDNGAFIMIVVFALVIIGLVGAIFLMMGSNKNKKD